VFSDSTSYPGLLQQSKLRAIDTARADQKWKSKMVRIDLISDYFMVFLV
jgi:hypothetical protein